VVGGLHFVWKAGYQCADLIDFISFFLFCFICYFCWNENSEDLCLGWQKRLEPVWAKEQLVVDWWLSWLIGHP